MPGLTADAILRLVDCSDVTDASSGLVHVPEFRREAVGRMFPGKNYDPSHHHLLEYVTFCAERCSDQFLQLLAELHREFMEKLRSAALIDAALPSLSGYVQSSLVLTARLHELDMLAPSERETLVCAIIRNSIDGCDPRWMHSREIRFLLTQADIEEIYLGVRQSAIGNVTKMCELIVEDYEKTDAEVDEHLDYLRVTIDLYSKVWHKDSDWCEKLAELDDEVSCHLRGDADMCDWPDPQDVAMQEGDLMMFADIDECDGERYANSHPTAG